MQSPTRTSFKAFWVIDIEDLAVGSQLNYQVIAGEGDQPPVRTP
jgi:hypothetical protein